MEQAKTTTSTFKPKLVYSIIAVCALVSASVLAVGIYGGFFDDLNSEATAQEDITAPMDEGVNTETPSLDEIMN